MAAYKVSDVAALLRDASMSASYKPALLKAIVRVCRADSSLVISLERLGSEFAKLYWNQTILYHLRQAAALSKESEVIKLIRATSERLNTRKYHDLPPLEKDLLARRMARKLTINVLAAFHTSAPKQMPRLYEWAGDEIRLTPAALSFLQTEGAALEALANYSWAKFLETTNRLAPKLIQKVESNGLPRTSLAPYLAILLEEEDPACFYCGRTYERGTDFAVDHVIPRSFLMEDPLWDLVIACGPCNGSKSDILPERTFIERLIERNAVRARMKLPARQIGMLHGYEDVGRLYDAAISVEWPRFWSP